MRFSEVSCPANSDVGLTPPENNGAYMAVLAQPKTTWETMPFIFNPISNIYYLHAKGDTEQVYVITWIVN